MADIRINALANTASTTASDDYLAVDGTTNGTRKLSAYSPTFGGNFQANGTGTIGGNLTVSGGAATLNNATESYLMLQIGGANKAALDAIGTTLNVLNYSAGNTDFYIGGNNPANKVLSLSTSATTVAGNLTVSGTGTSSFAGKLLLGNTTSTGTTNPITLSTGGTYGTAISNGWKLRAYEDSSGNIAGVGISSTAVYLGSSYSNTIQFISNGSEIARFDSSLGNFLLKSDGVDSGNGKLQLATHTNVSGGVGLGTDISFYRNANNSARIRLNGTTTELTFDNGGLGTGGSRIVATAALTITSNGANSFYLQTGGTTALTLDSSQRCILAGALRLNNAYTAGAPTATGYVTLQDSAGNTYKVLVGT
jgi:hypothetical protein